MNSDRRLVYSTEHGTVEKSSRPSGSSCRKKSRSTSSVIKKPAKQGVRIRRESKGRGGKTVSVVEGLPLDGPELKALLKRLKATLGTGGTLKDGAIEIQGDHRERLLGLLQAEGFKAKHSGG